MRFKRNGRRITMVNETIRSVIILSMRLAWKQNYKVQKKNLTAESKEKAVNI